MDPFLDFFLSKIDQIYRVQSIFLALICSRISKMSKSTKWPFFPNLVQISQSFYPTLEQFINKNDHLQKKLLLSVKYGYTFTHLMSLIQGLVICKKNCDWCTISEVMAHQTLSNFGQEPPLVYLFHILCTVFYATRVYMKLKICTTVVLLVRSTYYKLLATVCDRLFLNSGQTFLVCT